VAADQIVEYYQNNGIPTLDEVFQPEDDIKLVNDHEYNHTEPRF